MFKINIHCVVFGVNESLNKRCILSTNKQDIVFPVMELTDTDQINNQVIAFLKQYIFVNDLVLIPQIINLHSSILNTEKDVLNIVLGFITDYNSSIDNTQVCWLEFDLMKEHKFSPVIFETIQKLT